MDRPDLDEFLSALSGFIDQKVALPEDPSYHRFLEIFCRSVGSAEGHLLQYVEGKGLQSVVSSGVPESFSTEFNTAVSQPGREPIPLDSAFRDQQVMAVVEIKRGTGIPDWFFELSNKYRFRSLIAVPLIGSSRAMGVLCAYYRDACLFDRSTLDRLMTIGRMVGTALEKSGAPSSPNGVVGDSSHQKIFDDYLSLLTTQPVGRAHVYDALAKAATKAFLPSALICGPVRVAGNELVLTVAAGTGIPVSAQSQRFPFPPTLARQLLLGKTHISAARGTDDLGALKPLVTGTLLVSACEPVMWQKQPQAAILLWRSSQKPFTTDDGLLLTRLAGVTALMLRIA